jgi:uncharacterized protein YjaZ
MSANIYTIESLLVGKTYRSNTLTGEIISAEKDTRAVWYGDNTESYLVTVKPNNSYNSQIRTVAVKVGE